MIDPDILDKHAARLEAAIPRIMDLLLDIVEGRRFVVVETLPRAANEGGGFTTSLLICDNPNAVAPEAVAEAPAEAV